MQRDTVNSVAKDLRGLGERAKINVYVRHLGVRKSSVSRWTVISIPSEQSLLVEMLEGANKRKWMALRGVEIVTGYCKIRSPKAMQKMSLFITYFKCFIYVRSYTEEHRDTQGTDTDFFFTDFLV